MTPRRLRFHGFFRSSAAYRVRIALHLKGLDFEEVGHDLRRDEQAAAEYLRLNPQGLVPALETGDGIVTQTLAICEYLDEITSDPPLLPSDPFLRARVRGFAQVIACDIHPVQNLKILKRVRGLGADEDGVRRWAAQAIEDGLDACERLVADQSGPYCFGAAPMLADIFLVPQLANARRFRCDLRWPRLLAVEAHCLGLPAFRAAAPEAQPDYEEF